LRERVGNDGLIFKLFSNTRTFAMVPFYYFLENMQIFDYPTQGIRGIRSLPITFWKGISPNDEKRILEWLRQCGFQLQPEEFSFSPVVFYQVMHRSHRLIKFQSFMGELSSCFRHTTRSFRQRVLAQDLYPAELESIATWSRKLNFIFIEPNYDLSRTDPNMFTNSRALA
jgi:hypothetical protein